MSKISRSRCCALSLLLLMLVPAGSAFADDKGKDPAKRLQQKVQSLEREKSQLAQAKAQLDAQLKEAGDQIGKARQGAESANRKRAALDKALKAAEAEKAELAEKLSSAEQRLLDTEKNLAATTATLQQTQEAKRRLESGLAMRTQELSGCTSKNESLHRMGVTLLKQYQEKSCLMTVLENEPLTQLKRADAENMVEEYREKLDQELVNQQLEARQKLARQKAEALRVEQEKAEAEKAEKLLAEQEMVERQKAKQQSDLNKITRKIKSILGSVEW